MAITWTTIKRDFTRHRRKAMVLGGLTLVMAGLIVKAYFDLNPESASGAVPIANLAVAADSNSAESSADADTDTRLNQSKELWRTLRTAKGAKANEAFTFVASLYQIDPSRRPGMPVTSAITPLSAPQVDGDLVERQRQDAIHDRARRELIVRTTIMGTAMTKPQAIVNQQVLSVGDPIKGFTITAIRGREVDFSVDGVITTISMNNDSHGP
jgi:hypothetical protein